MNNQTGRVMEILQQIKNDSLEIIRSDQVKVGLSLLGVLSRDVSNRMVIVNHGIDIVITVMNIYINKVEIIGTGCNLLWILAFDCPAGVENIIKNDGILLIIKSLVLHHKAENVTKTACAVISNAFFSPTCQNDFYTNGGIQSLISALHSQYAQSNHKVLPFIFDAIGTIALNNIEISKAFSILGIIPFILTAIKSISINGVLKSGTQLLSILSTIDGLTSTILVNDGLSIILNILDTSPISIDIHRVASIVLLRLLEESPNVCREFTELQGTKILLKIIHADSYHVDTLVAFWHILLKSSRLNTIGISWSQLEGQFWGPNSDSQKQVESNPILPIHVVKSKGTCTTSRNRGYLQALLNAFSVNCTRKDIARPACRYFASIISNGIDVAEALFELGILDKVFRCVHIHSEVKDIIDSASVILLQLQRKYLQNQKRPFNSYFILKHDNCHDVIYGIIHIFQSKCNDDELALACIKLLLESVRLVMVLNPLRNSNTESHSSSYKERIKAVFDISLVVLQRVVNNNIDSKCGTASDASYKRPTTSNAMPRNGSVASNSVTKSSFSAKDSVVMFDDCNLGIRAKSYSSRSATIHGNDSNFTRQYEALVEEQLAAERAKRIAFFQHVCSTVLALLYEITTLVLPNIPVDIGYECTDKLKSTLQLMLDYQQVEEPVLTERIDKIIELFGLTLDSGASSDKTAPGSPLKRSGSTKAKKKSFETKFIDVSPPYEEKFCPREVTLGPSSDAASDDQSKGSDPTPVSDVIDSLNMNPKIKVVYEYNQSNTNNNKSITSTYRQIPPYATDATPHPFKHSITFSSEFECGNLLRAIQRDEYSYDLILRNDFNTPEQLTQWYYFAVTNIFSPKDIQRFTDQGEDSVPVKIQFQIINFYKPESLYTAGMRPVIYSCFDAAKSGQGWVRAGSNISYHSNAYPQKYNGVNRETSSGNCLYQYSLRFTIEFKNVNDTVYIAHSYPYSYNDHKVHLSNLLKKPNISDMMSISTLCKTINGEECDLLVITDFKTTKDIGPINLTDAKEELMASALKKTVTSGPATKYRPALFFSSRVHPGEAPASWMMKGFIDFLVSDHKDAVFLRNTYVIFIIPMLNPDGVILGNYRCNLAGVDLNRQWKFPSKTLHPTIFHMKSLMVAQKKLRNIAMFIDFHGHSAKHNVFLYGYDDKKEKKPRPHIRQFPSFFSSHVVGSKYLCLEDCSYNIMRGHENTARVVCATDLNIHYTYTLETTFGGCDFGPLQGVHYNMHNLMQIGTSLAEAISQFLADKDEKTLSTGDSEQVDMVDVIELECATPPSQAGSDNNNNSPIKGLRAQPSSKVSTGIRVTRNTLGDGTLLKSPSYDLKLDVPPTTHNAPTGHIKSNEKCFSIATDALETLLLSKNHTVTEEISPSRSKRRNKKGAKSNSHNGINDLQITPTKSKLASIMLLSPINSFH